VSGSGRGYITVAMDVRNNILDTTDPIYVCDTYNSNYCGDINQWDYNDDGGSHGNPGTGVIGPHDLIGVNPEYVSASGGNFHLQAGSPCVGAGEPNLTQGNNDIGAY
jgi:hypothetical protein